MDASPWRRSLWMPQLGRAAQPSLPYCLLLSWLGVLKSSWFRDDLQQEQSPQELGQGLLCAASNLGCKLELSCNVHCASSGSLILL